MYQHLNIQGQPVPLPVTRALCIGRNYLEHIQELNNTVPDEALLFNRPADSSGVVMAFRRPDSQTSQMQLKLHGLELSTTYVVSQIDGRVVGRVSGAKLSTDGLLVDLPKPRTAGVYQYRKR